MSMEANMGEPRRQNGSEQLQNTVRSNSIHHEVHLSSHDKPIVRIKPSMLVGVLSSLSNDQKSWISSTGFDSIISFELNEYPVKLSEVLLSSFEPNPSVLRINEIFFEIVEEDWGEIFGQAKQCYQVTTAELCRIIDIEHVMESYLEHVYN